MNLLKETKAALKDNGYSLDDVDWVGCWAFRIPMEAFIEAADVEYDEGFGAQKVAEDLIVVLKDGSWLERSEYDGSEWWGFRERNRRPTTVWDGAVALTVDQAGGDLVGWQSLLALCGMAEKGRDA